jgi:hypothetical protein
MLNPGFWNWGNYAGFFWGGICFLCVVYTYYRVPEVSFVVPLISVAVESRDFVRRVPSRRRISLILF